MKVMDTTFKKFKMIWSVLNWSIVEYFVSLVCTCHVDYKSRPLSATTQFNILHTLANELTNHFTNETTLASQFLKMERLHFSEVKFWAVFL